jgi:hypothetical protein
MRRHLHVESGVEQVFDEIPTLFSFLNLLDDFYWAAEVGVCGQGDIADLSRPYFVNGVLIFFGLTGNTLWGWS